MKIPIIFVLIAFASAAIGLVAGMCLSEPGTSSNAGVEDSCLLSEDLEERQAYLKTALELRDSQVSELIELASESVELLPAMEPEEARYPWRDSKHLAIVHLGDLRGSAAVQVLLDNLEYRNPRELAGSYLDVGGWYPAGEALAKIGMPAVKPVIEKLGSYSADSKGSEICCWILTKVLGAELAKVQVEMAIRDTRDEGARKNLEAALPYLKATKEKSLY